MRVTLPILIGLIAGATLNSVAVDTARADQYKWCAIMGGETGASANCYFVTLQQCEAYVTGVGGFCTPSPFAGDPPAGTQKRAPAQRQRN